MPVGLPAEKARQPVADRGAVCIALGEHHLADRQVSMHLGHRFEIRMRRKSDAIEVGSGGEGSGQASDLQRS